VIEPDETACPCCGCSLHLIGEDRAEMLDYVPSQLRVRLIRRPRLGCCACEGTVIQAPAPERPIDDDLATEALVVNVVISKYCDHTPLSRQSQIIAPGHHSGPIHPLRLSGPRLLVVDAVV
jgi:transposase